MSTTTAIFSSCSSQLTGIVSETLPTLSSLKACFCSLSPARQLHIKTRRTHWKLSSTDLSFDNQDADIIQSHSEQYLGDFKHLPVDWASLTDVPNSLWIPMETVTQSQDNHWNVSYLSKNTFAENKATDSVSSRRSLFTPVMYQLHTNRQKLNFISRRYKHIATPRNEILFLEYMANQQTSNPTAQAAYLKSIVNEDPDYVINRIESNRFASNEEVKELHMKALILTNRISWSEIKRKFSRTNNESAGKEHDPMHVVVVEQKKDLYKRFGHYLRMAALVGFALSFFVVSKLKLPNPFNGKEFLPDKSTQVYRFEDVQGCDEAKEELEEVVEFLREPEKFQKLGAKLPGGVLLIGPPGTGKTLLARAIAGEADVPFFFASGSEFDEMFVGVGAARVRKLFAAAKEHAPAIIFLDELDAIGGKRNTNDNQPYSRMTLNQLLVELDGFSQYEGVIVIGATNFPEILDKALTRPGRFDSKVYVTMPDVRGRIKILKLYLKKTPCDPDIDVEVLARGTPGFSGADISNLVNQAALRAASLGRELINMEHIEWARDKIIMGPERKSAVIAETNRNLVAYHEGGHAIVALYTPDAEPVHKATVVPRGSALGYVMQLPEKDDLSWTKKQLLAKMDVCMGGRVAEEIIYGIESITTGASSDMQQASRIARAMVTQYGMSEKVGTVLIDEQQDKLSPELTSAIESEVRRLIQEAYERAKAILKKRSKEHKKLAEALLKYETLSAEEIKCVVKGLPIDAK